MPTEMPALRRPDCTFERNSVVCASVSKGRTYSRRWLRSRAARTNLLATSSGSSSACHSGRMENMRMAGRSWMSSSMPFCGVNSMMAGTRLPMRALSCSKRAGSSAPGTSTSVKAM